MDLSALRSLARYKADETVTTFIGNAELDVFLNEGYRFVYNKVISKFEDFFIQPGTNGNGGLFSTVSGTQGYSLPSDCQKIVRVEHRSSSSTSDNDWRKLEKLNIVNDRYDDFYPVRDGYTPGFGYFVAGNKIYLKPVPSQVFSVRIWYIPRITALSGEADVPSVPEEFHELIAEYAAIQVLRKSGEPIWRESIDTFKLGLDSMLDAVQHRDQQPEQMVISDSRDFDVGVNGI